MSIKTAFDDRIAIAVEGDMPVNQAKALLKSNTGLNDEEIEVVHAYDARSGEKLEMKSEKLGEKMLWWHCLYGGIGLIVGMILAFLLVSFGPEFTQENPIFTYIALISPGIFLGLFVAGARSLKPQHDVTNLRVKDRQADESPTIVVKPERDIDTRKIERAVNSINGLSLLAK